MMPAGFGEPRQAAAAAAPPRRAHLALPHGAVDAARPPPASGRLVEHAGQRPAAHVDVAAHGGPKVELHQRAVGLAEHSHVVAHTSVTHAIAHTRRQPVKDAAKELLEVPQHDVHLQAAVAAVGRAQCVQHRRRGTLAHVRRLWHDLRHLDPGRGAAMPAAAELCSG